MSKDDKIPPSRQKSEVISKSVGSGTLSDASSQQRSFVSSNNAPTTISGVGRTTDPAAKKKSKLRSFTRKATKLAADVAFGATVDDDYIDAKLESYRQEARRKAESTKLELELKQRDVMLKTLRGHLMEFYLDYLRFFMKYMDDSEWSDSLNYAGMRNDLWRGWLRKFFIKVDEVIEYWDTHDEPKPKEEVSQIKLTDIPAIDTEIFHDRKISLLMLWLVQSMKRVMNLPLITKRLTANMSLEDEVCIITSNKLKSTKVGPNELFPKLLNTHIPPAHLEFIDGWQTRHDFKNRVNFLTLNDRFQTLSDLRGAGTLPDDILQQYPHFNDREIIDQDFIDAYMDDKERNFLMGYSSFSVPAVYTLPLDGGKHGLITSPDFSRLVKTQAEMVKSLAEFHRLLRPGGKIHLQLIDLTPIPKSSVRVGLNIKNYLEISQHEYVRLLINSELSEIAGDFCSNMSIYLLMELKKSPLWKNVEFCKIGFPVIEGQNYGAGVDGVVEIKKEDEINESEMDSRVSSLFDMNASYLDYLKFTSILGVLDWRAEWRRPDDKIFSLGKLWVNWRRFGLNGTLVRELLASRELVDGNIDKELGVKVIKTTDEQANDQNSRRNICGVNYLVSVVAERV